jgi:hypothetical protein
LLHETSPTSPILTSRPPAVGAEASSMHERSTEAPLTVRHRSSASPARDQTRAVKVAWLLGVWGLAYACYRAYYAVGGQVGMIGQPRSQAQFEAVNAFGAAIIAAAAVLPVVFVRVPSLRRTLPTIGWIAAVGCCMHALTDATLRVLSITGVYPTRLPASFWQSFDRRTADLQDLLLNEPWFFVEGLLWAALGLALVSTARRRAWLTSALAVCAATTVVGVLSGVDVIARFHVG